MKYLSQILILILISVFFTKCAKKGSPSGGEKDETAPLLVTAKPPYGTTNFKEKSIKIYFDEYVVLKNIGKQLIISPPLKNKPIITPQGTASKYINIKFSEELKPNTTYTFNFGNAIQDNNEGNKLEGFKYVFSTGSVIDSLTLKGKVSDALKGKLTKNSSLLLYKLDSVYNDSIPYREKPTYVTNTTDSLNFEFTNLKKGKYVLLAIQEENSDYIFNPKKDKIGFLKQPITLPKDSILNEEITVFKETQPFKFKKGKEVSKGKIIFRYTGKQKDFNVKLLTKVPAEFKAFSKFEKNKDSLNYWFTPIKQDSLNFIVKNDIFIDTTIVRLGKKKLDSLKINPSINDILHYTDTLFLKTNNPIIALNDKKIGLVDKDTLNVDFKIQKKINSIAILFDKKPKNSYTLSALPKAITDIYNTPNDSLKYNFKTIDLEDYGSISLTINNKTEKSLIIQLIEKDKIIRNKFLKNNSQKIDFKFLKTRTYKIRAIVDDNDNNTWDTGKFLSKKQPERIIYFNKEIKLRANWTIDEIFDVE